MLTIQIFCKSCIRDVSFISRLFHKFDCWSTAHTSRVLHTSLVEVLRTSLVEVLHTSLAEVVHTSVAEVVHTSYFLRTSLAVVEVEVVHTSLVGPLCGISCLWLDGSSSPWSCGNSLPSCSFCSLHNLAVVSGCLGDSYVPWLYRSFSEWLDGNFSGWLGDSYVPW